MPIDGNEATDLLSWLSSSIGSLSFIAAWSILWSRAAVVPWTGLIRSRLFSPRLACLSWRILHRKSTTELWAKLRGWSLASRCHSCFSFEETDSHLFFSCSMAQQLWSWILILNGTSPPSPLSASVIWSALAKDRDVLGKEKWVATIFFHNIFILWTLRSDSKHNKKKPSLGVAKLLLIDRLKELVSSLPGALLASTPHPTLVSLGLLDNQWVSILSSYFLTSVFLWDYLSPKVSPSSQGLPCFNSGRLVQSSSTRCVSSSL